MRFPPDHPALVRLLEIADRRAEEIAKARDERGLAKEKHVERLENGPPIRDLKARILAAGLPTLALVILMPRVDLRDALLFLTYYSECDSVSPGEQPAKIAVRIWLGAIAR
jgi:hypothetical protein